MKVKVVSQINLIPKIEQKRNPYFLPPFPFKNRTSKVFADNHLKYQEHPSHPQAAKPH